MKNTICKENSELPEKLGRTGFIGRFRPLHLGGSIVLEQMCERSEHVIIGIGSANKYNYRTPFTADETAEMIDRHLSKKYSNYSIVKLDDSGHIPKYSDGKKWVSDVRKIFGYLDYFITGNDYVKSLLKDDYKIVHPAELIYNDNQIQLRGTYVRLAMSYSDEWKTYVPERVSEYIVENGLDRRFRKEFGLEMIEKSSDGVSSDDIDAERENVRLTA